MSKYCGKCDIYDCYGEYSDERLQNIQFWAGGDQVDIKSQKDLMPYYPFIVAFSCGDIVHMSYRSYVDAYEEQTLQFYLNMAQKEYRAAKRKKLEIKPETVSKKISWNNDPYVQEIVKRVIETKGKGTIDGLTMTGMVPVYREALFNDMIAAGYDENFARQWVYEHGNTHTMPDIDEHLTSVKAPNKKKDVSSKESAKETIVDECNVDTPNETTASLDSSDSNNESDTSNAFELFGN